METFGVASAPFVACMEACVRMSSVSQVGTFIPPSAQSERVGGDGSSEFCTLLSGRCGGGNGVWEAEEENRGSAPVGLGTY